jgi:WhiB family redox-sensing transcriptional regulator
MSDWHERPLERPVWRAEAVCKGLPISWFFDPVETVLEGGPNVREICRLCPVKNECLEEALTYENQADLAGIWGGLDETERKQIRKDRRKKK